MTGRERTPTPIDATTNLAQALRQIGQILQGQQAQQAQPIEQAVRPRVSMNDFLSHHPVKFNGKVTPDEAEDWICKLEKIFYAIECTEGQKLVFTTYMLAGEAEYWWCGMRRGMDARGEVATWAEFKNMFLERYFPASAKQECERQFLALRQGSMSVQEYKERFEYLARFYTYNPTEEWKCRRFEQGLRHQILKALVHLKINDFSELVEQALVAERLDESVRVMRNQRRNFSRDKYQKKPYDGPERDRPRILKCFECGGDHLRRNCPKLDIGRSDEKKCYKCHKPGHFAYSCPEKKTVKGTPSHQKLSG
ncbi:uncharacterized protein LOC106754964 [Vigna radiata var. radiata]|uniref:Uncharacterized protein LOC106754964 n=1 Tax=Vigna radiata var. radiata TaxID=3916 RepID=A0A1S3TFH8_VIGRR|nr:uncharacterized protein LOC106754964 [Vigna radiata var. radiata]